MISILVYLQCRGALAKNTIHNALFLPCFLLSCSVLTPTPNSLARVLETLSLQLGNRCTWQEQVWGAKQLLVKHQATVGTQAGLLWAPAHDVSDSRVEPVC